MRPGTINDPSLTGEGEIGAGFGEEMDNESEDDVVIPAEMRL